MSGLYAIQTQRFIGDGEGRVAGLQTIRVEQGFENGRMSFEPIDGTEEHHRAQFVLLALGFVGPERSRLLEGLGVAYDDRGNVARNDHWMTNVDGVFVCGDMGRGQSLIVWAIAEGRSCAAAADHWLEGRTLLPAPVTPTDRPLR